MSTVAGPGDHTLLCDGRPVAPLIVADTPFARGRGLLGTSGVVGAMWLNPCSSVHMLGMRYPIDVATLDRDGLVLDVRTLRPWTGVTWPRLRARTTVEAAEGFLAAHGIAVGSRLAVGARGPRPEPQ